MTNAIRRLIIICMGLTAGLCAWPLVELVLASQEAFPSYFLYSSAIGSLVGAILGAFFAAAGGLCDRAPGKALDGAWKGALAGLAGGVLSTLVAQGLLFYFGDRFLYRQSPDGFTEGNSNTALLIAQAAGWLVVGAAIGIAEGLRAKSARKVALGFFGGIAGGGLGGLLFTWLTIKAPDFNPGRLLALMLMGGLIAVFYALLERRFAVGSLKVLNGPLKGKEFLVNQRRLRLGSDSACDIVLAGYRDVAAHHGELIVKKGELVLRRGERVVIVNDRETAGQTLKLDDVIKLGSATFLYGYFG